MSKLVPLTMAALALAMLLLARPAFADGAIVDFMSEEDVRVLRDFDTRRTAAITLGRDLTEETAASAALRRVLAGQVLSFDGGYDPSGDWRCRFLKLGGNPPLVIYDWFSCRIVDDGAGWVVQKMNGSQRSMGRLYRLTQERLLYLGALHYGYEAPIWYGDDPSRNQIAVLARQDDGRMRLEFPAPLVASDFDILEFAP